MARSARTPRASDYRKLSKTEKASLGFKSGAKRFVLKGMTPTQSNTISGRKQHELQLSQRLGQKTTKEQYQKKIETGEIKYRNKKTAERQQHATWAKDLRKFVPEMTDRHKKVAYRWFELKQTWLHPRERAGLRGAAMTKDEGDAFDTLFSRYSRADLRQAFGSEARDTGSFPSNA
jgi:hypothetical protein